jgi:hypothetical protein
MLQLYLVVRWPSASKAGPVHSNATQNSVIKSLMLLLMLLQQHKKKSAVTCNGCVFFCCN